MTISEHNGSVPVTKKSRADIQHATLIPGMKQMMNPYPLSRYHNKKVLLLGGLGFIGSNLALPLVEHGAVVTLVDNFLPDHGANWHNIAPIRDQVNVNICDIRDANAMHQLVQDQDIIFNIAAQTSHSDSMKDPFLDTDINCRGNLVVLEACRQYNPKATLVFVGTRAYYGAPTHLPVTEEALISPRDIYSVNRYSAEQYHLLYQLHHGLKTTALRISNIYGPRAQMQHPKYNVLNWFVRLVLEKNDITVYGDGLQRRDYVYVADACQALLLAGISPQAVGQVLNVGSGEGVAFIDLIRQLLEVAGQGTYTMKPWPTGAMAYDVGDFVMAIDKIQTTLGWVPQTSLASGFEQTLDYYRKYQSCYWS